jgi:succinate--hydroxymethylglutarate CoA-transferase
MRSSSLSIRYFSNGPLRGIRVLDLSRILAGPYATMMLGDMGADIIKIERPVYGDDTRSWGPPFTEKGHESAYFLSVNRNKRSLVVDIKKEDGKKVIMDIAKTCDVLIENYAPGDSEKLGLNRDEFRASNERLIWCSITGYGKDGPLASRLGYAVLVEAHAGLMHSTGPRDGEPVKVGVAMTDILTGLHASTSILAALHHRTLTGKGTVVECSLLESQVSAMANLASNWLIGGQEAKRLGTDHASIVPYGCVKTRNGVMALAAGNDSQFDGLCRVLGIPEISLDERFRTNANRVANRDVLIHKIEKITSTRSTSEWMKFFDEAEKKFAYAPVNSMKEVFEDPQVIHRNMVVEVEHSSAGRIKLPGVPVKFPELTGQAGEIRFPPPVLGEHSREILREVLKMHEDRINELIANNVVFTS